MLFRCTIAALGLALASAWRAPLSRKDVLAPVVQGMGWLALGQAAVAAEPIVGQATASNAGAVPTRIGGQYYFPTARYRYLPRIFAAWNMLSTDGPEALMTAPVDWETMDEVLRKADDITTALPLFADAIEGARSSKKKTKGGLTKALLEKSAGYKKEVVKLDKAVKKRDAKATELALKTTTDTLLLYRQIAAIDGPDGGMVEVPENMKKYVPVFRGMPTEAVNSNNRAAKGRLTTQDGTMRAMGTPAMRAATTTSASVME